MSPRRLAGLLSRARDDCGQLDAREQQLLDDAAAVLQLVVAVGGLLTVAMLGVVSVVAIVWHATIPTAIGVVPFCAALLGQAGLALIGRGEMPGGA
jgi:hypothetical protein